MQFPKPARPALVLVVLGLVLSIVAGCSRDETEVLQKARNRAKEFHNAMIKRDVDELVHLVDYPFTFDDTHLQAHNEAEFRKIIAKRWSEMFRKIDSARLTEQITYETFVEGGEIRGNSYDPDEARKQAKKINFREGGVLVCCYHVDDETKKQDQRAYYLVMQPNALGDLKVVTYHD